jgi:hypothetical protein
MKPTTRACGVAFVALLLLFAALGPAKWQLRTGLGWQIDHICGYFAFTLMVYLVWPRALLVGGAVTAFALLLEGLQAFTPDRHPDLQAALYSAGGVLAAALPADLFFRAPMRLNGRTLLMHRAGHLGITHARGCRRPLAAVVPPGSGGARGVAPQSPALTGLVSQQSQSG